MYAGYSYTSGHSRLKVNAAAAEERASSVRAPTVLLLAYYVGSLELAITQKAGHRAVLESLREL